MTSPSRETGLDGIIAALVTCKCFPDNTDEHRPLEDSDCAAVELMGLAREMRHALEVFLGCLPADMSIWRAMGLDTSRLTLARLKAMAALAKVSGEWR